MPNLPDFTGRNKELSELLALVEKAPQLHASSPRIIAIDGMGGAGKTSLAVRATYLVADRFDDGHLSLDLRGFTPGEEPLSPMTALDSLLRAVGIPDRLIPDSVACRERLWQTTLSGRHMILLLDNAAEAAQVRPLLPASSGCLVLVTSRTRLLDLDGAHWISLGEMSLTESASFVAQTLSREKVDAEPEAAAELVKQCGGLPLALRLATARLRNRPRWTIRYLVERLRDESRRMDELRSNERSVAATLQLSYAAMSASHREAFRLLALHPGAVVDTDASAALLGAHEFDAEDALESLVDAHLLQQPEAGLYAFHDLVRTFARNLAEGDGDDAAAVERLLSFYVTTTDAACDTLFPSRTRRPTGLSRYAGTMPELTDTVRATAWLNREHSGLLASVQLAEQHGLDRHVVCLARNLSFQLNARGQLAGLRDVGRSAVEAARRLGDPAMLCVALSNFSSACWKLGRTEESFDAATEAHALAIRAGDEHTEAHSGAVVGLLLTEFGRYDDALVTLDASIALAKELGDLRVEAESLTTLSTLHERAGRSVEAAEVAQRAIAVSRSIRYRDNEIVALTDLAIALVSMGVYTEAHRMLLLAHGLCNESTSPGDLSLVLAMSAVVARHLGDRSRARRLADRALDLARTSHARVRVAKVQNLLGSLEASWGNHSAARILFTQARDLAVAMNLWAEEAAALIGLADLATDLDESGVAARHHMKAESPIVGGPHTGDGARPEPSKADHQVMAW